MKKMKIDNQKKLALLAIVLGFFAIFAGTPYNKSIKIDLEEFALASSNDVDKVQVEELADWIIQGKYDYRLVDLRKGEKYSEYFIPTAVNLQTSKLIDAGLMRNQKIIVYSDDNIDAARAWFLLKANDYKGVYILDGGLDGWKENILFPKLAANAGEDEAAQFAKIKEVSKFFGGVPQTGSSDDREEVKMPELKAPAAIPMNTGAKKPKREGC